MSLWMLQFLWNMFLPLRHSAWNDSTHKDGTKTQLNARASDGWEPTHYPRRVKETEKCRQKVASNLADNPEKTELGSVRQIWGLARKRESWMKCLPGAGPINIPWHPIDFSKWAPFLIWKSSPWVSGCSSAPTVLPLWLIPFAPIKQSTPTYFTLTLPRPLTFSNIWLIKWSH